MALRYIRRYGALPARLPSHGENRIGEGERGGWVSRGCEVGLEALALLALEPFGALDWRVAVGLGSSCVHLDRGTSGEVGFRRPVCRLWTTACEPPLGTGRAGRTSAALRRGARGDGAACERYCR